MIALILDGRRPANRGALALEPIGCIPPAEAESNYYRQLIDQVSFASGLEAVERHSSLRAADDRKQQKAPDHR